MEEKEEERKRRKKINKTIAITFAHTYTSVPLKAIPQVVPVGVGVLPGSQLCLVGVAAVPGEDEQKGVAVAGHQQQPLGDA